MNSKQFLYIINNKKEAALLEFPAKFAAPSKRVVNKVTYYKTDRVRRTKNYEALIYTELPCTLNLDDFSIPVEESTVPEAEAVVNTPAPRDSGQTNEPTYNPNSVSYYAVRCGGQFSTGANSSSLPTPRLYLSAKNAKKAADKVPLYKSEGYEIVKFTEVGVVETVEGEDE
jgi:hypothetical protein